MFTYFLVGEDSSLRLQRLSSSPTASTDGLVVKERRDTTAELTETPQELPKARDDRGWSTGQREWKRPPPLPRCEHGKSCDLAIESIFPNFRRSLLASKRRRFRHRSTVDAVMSNSLQDCSVHDVTTRPLKHSVGVIHRETTLSTLHQ